MNRIMVQFDSDPDHLFWSLGFGLKKNTTLQNLDMCRNKLNTHLFFMWIALKLDNPAVPSYSC